MRGLVLEGGGAKGAYHIGVVKALFEKGYEFDGYAGTSIGAINAAMMAQGDFDEAYESWMNITIEKVIHEDTRRAILEESIDEEKIRNSGKDFGLVTVSLTDLKPYELMLEDIPRGQLVNYIMASSSLPILHQETINEKKFLDGAFYNNCPINLLASRNYDEIIVVRTHAFGIFHKTEDPRVKLISPQADLGNVMQFTHESIVGNIRLGYFDGLRFTEKLLGGAYYIRPVDKDDFNRQIMSLADDVILEAGRLWGLREMPAKRMLFEKLIPQLGAYMKLGKQFDYADFIIALLERAAEQKAIGRFNIYDYDELRLLVKQASAEDKRKEPRAVARLLGNSVLSKKKAAVKILADNLL